MLLFLKPGESSEWRGDSLVDNEQQGRRRNNDSLPVCGKSSAKKPKSSSKRLKCSRRDDKPPADVTEPPPPTETETETAPSDAIPMDVPESGESPATADEPEAQMSEEERKCYYIYMNKKLDEYEPIWVSWTLLAAN